MSEAFAWDAASLSRIETILKRYPADRKNSGVIPLLDLAQRQNGGWLSTEAIECVAETLEMPRIRVLEVASFYTMFNLQPVGKHLVQLCRTTPCWLRGSEDLVTTCREVTGCAPGQSSDDGLFTVMEVECLGACCNAPMVQINDDFYEDLTPENFAALLNKLKAGQEVTPGSQTGRSGSEPEGGRQTLLSSAGASGPGGAA